MSPHPRIRFAPSEKTRTPGCGRAFAVAALALGLCLTALPVVGVVPGVLTFVGLTAGAHHYTMWSLRREYQRLPLTTWEKLTLVGLILLTIALFVLLIGVATLVGWSVAKLVEMFSGGVPWEI